MKILRVTMDGEEHPNYTITKAFQSFFEENNVKTIWWQKERDVNNAIVKEVTGNKYDAVFMQIQGDGVISEHSAQAISDCSLGFNWTGDARNDVDWYARFGKYFVTLFTNMTDVEKMRNLGFRSDYLQVGYDDYYYNGGNANRLDNIVFCANHYPNGGFPLTEYRRNIAHYLRNEFRERFNLYGNSWDDHSSRFVNNEGEADIYRSCGIAINCSHFDYSRYSSDRILREMACGAFVLTHRYKDIELDFTDNKHLVAWDSIPDLIDKCRYYLSAGNIKERQEIARNGQLLVQSTAKWIHRMSEFEEIIKKYKNQPK